MKIFLVLFIIIFSFSLFSKESEKQLSWYGKWKNSKHMTGSWGGVRTWLKKNGVQPELHFTNVVGKVFTGGHETGRTFPLLFKLGIGLHSEGLGLWSGTTFFAGAEWRSSFYGNGSLTTDYAGAFQTLNDIDDTKHYLQFGEYWFSQTLFHKKVGFKIGKQYSTDIFLNQRVSREFVNTSFRYLPTVPLSRYRTGDKHFEAFVTSPTRKQHAPSLGVAFWWQVADLFKLSAGVFDQRPEESHLLLSTASEKYKNISVITELLFTPEFTLNRKVKGEYRIGIWYVNKTDYSGTKEEDMHPHAKKFSGTGGPYITFDQMVYKENGSITDDEGLYLFGQFGFAPGKWESMLYYGGGVLYEGLFPTRERDTTGVAVGALDFSPKMEGETDVETGEYVKTYDMSDYETVFEWFYKIQAGNWLSVHHGLQWIRVPKGIKDPWNRYYEKDAFIFNVRGEFIF